MADWITLPLVAALLLSAMTCRMGDPHPLLADNPAAPPFQTVGVGESLPASPTAPLSGEHMTHHSQCVMALLVLSLLAVSLAPSASITIPPVMCLSQRTTAPLLPPP